MDPMRPVTKLSPAGVVLLTCGLLPATAGPQVLDKDGRLHSILVGSVVEELNVTTGSWSSGSLLDLEESDDVRLGLDGSGAEVELTVAGTAPSESLLSLSLVLEARPLSGLALQTIALRDFTSMAFVQVNERLLSPGGDVVTRTAPAGGLARFIESGTRRMEARIGFRWQTPIGQPQVALDRLVWSSRVRSFQRTIDLADYDAPTLNSSANWIRTVFDLAPDRMLGLPNGVQLAFDVSDPGPYDYTFRAELRERNITTYPRPGTTQVYRMRFDVDDLPDLYGPVTIFQRFSRFNDGPDIEVELTGANQFSNAVPGDLQVVAFGDRLRLGKFLKAKNEMVVAIFNDAQGTYKVSLNGETLREETGLDTRASVLGSWTQFGLYPHGLHDAQNRADQRASGFTRAAFTYSSFSKLHVRGELDLGTITTSDPN